MFEICKHDVIFSWSRIQVFKFQTWHWVTQLAREILWGSLTSCPTHTSPFVTVYGAESFKSLVTLLNISIFYLWLLTFAGKNKLKVELCVRLQLSSSLHPKPPILVKPELCKRILLKMNFNHNISSISRFLTSSYLQLPPDVFHLLRVERLNERPSVLFTAVPLTLDLR